ncbi:Actin cytoskeleton-regulatory complex protein pan1 [Hondaea fermentalgiana]|uniref:Actin cytoskeleton-regulatory complex protein pan1 n=1 Tax=Hondaea fermentalgiana TaxID=2315210 RepID=A0A2R5GJ17_9STRA|nr:Actin cytoskeleton-regulatory complex protein pan1 [Hondaea fermentalgiana]|eukprot:GBG30605.1 Actin cytoskeleton-regulatory complex protein pan1 [Hondaea fermentalgiana]
MVQYEPVLPEERQYYEELIKLANPSGAETFASKDLANFLSSSRLGVPDLRTVWNIGSESASKISRAHVITMMRCVALIQAGIQLSPEVVGHAKPGPVPMPKFEAPGVPPVPTNLVVPPAGESNGPPDTSAQRPSTPASVSGASAFDNASVSGSVSSSSWAMSPQKRAQYEELFKKQNVQNGKLGSQDAMEFFMKSRMPWEQLREILQLADLDQDLQLNVDEFCIAMHMVLCVSRKGYALPSEVPRELLPNQPRHAPPTAADAVAAAKNGAPSSENPPLHGGVPPPMQHQRQGSVVSQVSENGSLPDAAPLGQTHGGSFHSHLGSVHNDANGSSRSLTGAPMPARAAPAPAAAPSAPAPSGPSESDVQRATETNNALMSATATTAAVVSQLDGEKQRLEEEMTRLGAERDRLVDDLKSASEEVAKRQSEIGDLGTDLELLRETVTQLRVSVDQQRAQVQAVTATALEKLAEKAALEKEAAALKAQVAELQEQASSFQAALSSAPEAPAASPEAPSRPAPELTSPDTTAGSGHLPPRREAPVRAAPELSSAAESSLPVPEAVGAPVPAESASAFDTDRGTEDDAVKAPASTAATAGSQEATPAPAAETQAEPPRRRAPTREAPALSPTSPAADPPSGPEPVSGSEPEPPAAEGDAGAAADAAAAAAAAGVASPTGGPEGSTSSGWSSVPVSKSGDAGPVDSSAFDEAFDGDADPFEEAATSQPEKTAGDASVPASDVATAGAEGTASTTATQGTAPSTELAAAFSDAGFDEPFDFDKK